MRLQTESENRCAIAIMKRRPAPKKPERPVTATFVPVSFRLPRPNESDPFFGLTRNAYYDLERRGLLRLVRLTTPGKAKGRTMILHAEVQAILATAATKRP